MAIAVKREVIVDFNITRTVKRLTFLQFDTNIIKFIVQENGQDADLSNITNVIANFRRPDKKVISQVLTKNGNEIEYKLSNSEMLKVGVCELALHLYDDEERVSIAKFEVIIDENIENGEPPSEDDIPLITQVIQNVNNRVAELNGYQNQLTTVQNGLAAKASTQYVDEKTGELKYYVTPEMFGAVGDGVTNDAPKLYAMYQYARANKLSVQFQNKKYYCTGNVDAKGVSTYGVDGATIISVITPDDNYAFSWGGNDTSVENMNFILSNTVSEVPMQGINNGVYNLKNQKFIGNTVTCLTTKPDGLSNIFGLWVGGAGIEDFHVLNNKFVNTNYGIQFNLQYDYDLNKDITTPMGNPIKNIFIENNTCENCSIGINTPHAYSSNVFIKNNVASAYDMPINVAHCGHFVIDGNIATATNTTDSVIHVEDVTYDGKIINNIVTSNTTSDGIQIILAKGVSNDDAIHTEPIVIENNTIIGKPNVSKVGIHIADTASPNTKVYRNYVENFDIGVTAHSDFCEIKTLDVRNCNTGVSTTKPTVVISDISALNVGSIIKSNRSQIDKVTFKNTGLPKLYMNSSSPEFITYKNLEYLVQNVNIVSGTPFDIINLPPNPFAMTLDLLYGLYSSNVFVTLEIVYDGTNHTITQKYKNVSGYFGTTINTSVVNNVLKISQFISNAGRIDGAMIKVMVDKATYIKQ